MSILDAVPDAARSLWGVLSGDVEPPHETPSFALHDQPHQVLRRYGKAGKDSAEPVLLVPPLAAPTSCYDLRPGQSLVEYLKSTGRTPYLVDYGSIGFGDRAMGIEDWIDKILPNAISRAAFDADAPVDLVGWSLGGTLSLLTAAARADLPIRSVTAIGTPIDYTRVPLLRPVRMLGKITGGREVTAIGRMTGGFPGAVTRAGFRLTALDRALTKPIYIARNLFDTEALGRMQAVDRFMADMPGYPARFYTQVHHRLILRNDLARGVVELGDRQIALANVTAPVLLIAGTDDVLCTVDAARAGVDVLTGASVKFETAPGSHLGVLTGSTAPGTTWPTIDKFLRTEVVGK